MRTVALKKPSERNGSGSHTVALNDAFEKLFTLPSADATELLLVQHAEPEYRLALRGKPLGDLPLTEKGRCQAMRLAMRLRPTEIDVIFTSTMRPALETAALIAAAKDMPMIRAPQLREVEFDHPEPGDDVQKLDAEISIRFLARPRWDALKGFEPSRRFRHRVIQAIEAIASHHPTSRVVIVTHESVINAYLSMLLNIDRDMFFHPEHTSISVVRVLRDLYGVQNINDYAHLLPAFSPR